MEIHYPPKPPIETIKVTRYALHVTKTTPKAVSDVTNPKHFNTAAEAYDELLEQLTYWLSPFRNDDDPWPTSKAEDWCNRDDEFDALVAWEVTMDNGYSIMLTIYEEEHEYKIDTRPEWKAMTTS